MARRVDESTFRVQWAKFIKDPTAEVCSLRRQLVDGVKPQDYWSMLTLCASGEDPEAWKTKARGNRQWLGEHQQGVWMRWQREPIRYF
jgi:uncharacterized lipoprotein YddW (UPF0748 family)